MHKRAFAFMCWFVLFLFSCGDAYSATEQNQPFMPENTLHLESGLVATGSVTEADFHEVLDRLEEIYSPIFYDLGREFVIIRAWKDETVNAYAYEQGDKSIIKMFGGLARRAEVTKEGFALVACHEIGHHLGGFPYTSSWASNEGNSDYFATQICAKKLWGDAEDNMEFEHKIDPVAKYSCDQAYSGDEQRGLCYRSAAGGYSLARLLARGIAVSYSNPSQAVVAKTYNAHPEAQCRLDTYLQGATCYISGSDSKIPQTEREMTINSCSRYYGHTMGIRPLCWFKPKLDRPADDVSSKQK